MDSFMSFVGPGVEVVECSPHQSQKTLYYCPKCLHGFTLKSNRNRHYRYECGHEPRFKFERVFPLLYGSYGIGMYNSEKSDADHSGRGLLTRRGRRGTGRNHVCPKCGNGYSVIKSLRRHLRYECGLTPRFKCPYCGTRSKQRGHVSQHIHTKMIKAEASLEDVCSIMMVESKEFSYEEERPLNPRKNRSESMRGDIERHTCTRCFKSYIHAWHLKRHMKFECGQEPRVQCPYCTIKMKQRGHVYRHILPYMVISNNLHQQNCTYSVMPLMKNLTTLWMVKQRGDYPYRCEKCGKGYQHRGTLLRHTRHECGKEPQFKCPYCTRRTKQRGNLYQHIRTNHPGKNVFSSTLVVWEDYQVLSTNITSRSNNYIDRKLRVKRMDQIAGRYKCSKCGKSYRWKHHLVEHVKASCGQNKAECCPYCSYKSNRKWNLKSHMKRIHASV
ncbi:Gastrula zinc finger protein XlCGF57.1 [Ooceraea biroi]|uniref:Gastrula zinc finger protein XlCGF57.1 n=1 Tax=Ooceraea biroi TaxID=2015173 RepID=A0A026W5G8_OOCBI|nr:Gastrula zinc finger protein XlCGF57.1 [Ooceraea biroi]